MEDLVLSSKTRSKKVYITDIAIDKVPLIRYKGLKDSENDALYHLAKMLLLTSQKRK